MSARRPRYALVEQHVVRVLSEAQVSAAPVPIEDIVRSRGIQLRYPNLGEDISGVLIRDPTATVIGANRSHSKARQRFTIAHELGHSILHRGEKVHYDQAFRVNLRSGLSSQGTDVEEMEANAFAASILMPRSLLASDPNASVDLEDPVAVAELAKRYAVSVHAMSLRLAYLLARKP